MSTHAPAYEAPTELRITRRYEAPLALVWDAWTDDDQVRQWWGPRGFSLTTHAKELRPGGVWDYTMHGPDGTDWPNVTRYHVVEPQAALVYDHGASRADAAPLFRVAATFTAVEGETELDLRMILPSADAVATTRELIRAAGGNTTWDRLAEFLARRQSQAEVFVLARSVAAPIERVFDAWTTPERLAAWLPPTGMSMTFHQVDIRTGGAGVYTMGNGTVTLHSAIAYTRIGRPRLIVYMQCFTDANGRLARHPMAPTWPAYMQTTVRFAEEGPGRTRITIRWQPDPSATPDEIEAFVAARANMTAGWTGSLDKLDALLAEPSA
ncbi:MAG: SRPBCC domain-containing protein [Gemmatimonadaceae bacterium]|jgi:uncharacterized protein YndB with AHSA1/START domain|nr:SRPBCC domain-containing protein [Gemmatimonadaceae bacterium]